MWRPDNLKFLREYGLFQRGRRLVWFRTLAFQANDPGFESRRPHQTLLRPKPNYNIVAPVSWS